MRHIQTSVAAIEDELIPNGETLTKETFVSRVLKTDVATPYQVGMIGGSLNYQRHRMGISGNCPKAEWLMRWCDKHDDFIQSAHPSISFMDWANEGLGRCRNVYCDCHETGSLATPLDQAIQVFARIDDDDKLDIQSYNLTTQFALSLGNYNILTISRNKIVVALMQDSPMIRKLINSMSSALGLGFEVSFDNADPTNPILISRRAIYKSPAFEMNFNLYQKTVVIQR